MESPLKTLPHCPSHRSVKTLRPVLLLVVIFFGLTAADLASTRAAEEPVISLQVQNQPLGRVLAGISQETGYTITINEQWRDYPIDATFRDKPLEKGLKYILSDFNHAIFFGPGKTIKIIVYAPKDFKKSDLPAAPVFQPGPSPEEPQPREEPPEQEEQTSAGPEATAPEEPVERDEAATAPDAGETGTDAGQSSEQPVEQAEPERTPEDQSPDSPQNPQNLEQTN